MKSIYIVLTRSNTILSRLVHMITADPYTHVSISFDQKLQPLYSSSRKNGRTLFPAGPCWELFHSGYFYSHPLTPCAVYEMRVSDDAYTRAKEETESIMADSTNYHFNILGLILCKLNIPYHPKQRFFCSQFVSEILHRSHAITLPKDTSLMRPMDYTRLPDLHCVFRGRIGDLIYAKESPLKQKCLLSDASRG